MLSRDDQSLAVGSHRRAVDVGVGAVPASQLAPAGDVKNADRLVLTTRDRTLAVRQGCDDGGTGSVVDKALGLSLPSVGGIRRRLPELDGPIPARRDNLAAVGAEYGTGDVVGMALESQDAPAREGFPDLERAARAGHREMPAVGTPGQPTAASAVVEAKLFAPMGVPEPDRAVLARREQLPRVGMERQGEHALRMAVQHGP